MLISPRINSYSRFVDEINEHPGTIDASEALVLVDMAKDVNESSVGCFGPNDKGDRNLRRLVREHNDRFDSAGRSVVSHWLTKHEIRKF